ncbi:uncharacterized protein LOC144130229 isoform X1 [Amblyomma americanum]
MMRSSSFGLLVLGYASLPVLGLCQTTKAPIFPPQLDTPAGPIFVGCIYYRNGIPDVDTTYLRLSQTCVNTTVQAALQMKEYVNYTCPLGVCSEDICQSSGLRIGCWKVPSMLPDLNSMTMLPNDREADGSN